MKKYLPNINEIPFGTNPNNKTQTTFVLIHSEITPFLHYDSPNHNRDEKCKSFIMSNRANNTKGFIGGTLDKNENILDGLCREIDEEYGFFLDKSKLKPLCSHEYRIVSHLYEYEVEDIEFFRILSSINKNFTDFFDKNIDFLEKHKNDKDLELSSRESFGISHYFCETRCIEAVYITNKSRNTSHFLNNHFAGSVKEELEIFFKKENIIYE